ncbi:hypothetical protein SEPCBS119000_005393 [Sporothrix epigloea]|uniref:Autophagy-related protein 14 n=1 Tax=Sporothrix epigloea TaxID=1892477 RepID=A0ABP0DXM8_9PEZI
MSCEVCGRLYHSQRLPFLCAVDARNQLYETRIAHAVVLLQNEQLEAQVNSGLVTGPGVGGDNASTKESQPSPKRQAEAFEAERQNALDHTQDVVARAERLRIEMAATRAELERLKETLQQRRLGLAAANNGTVARRARLQADAERSIAMTRFKWNQNHEAMATSRAFLCMEASKLYGLRRLKKGKSVRYELGGLEVVDPYNLNNLPPEVVSTSLAHVAHILMLACHYLSIRLPAEITLPHRDYPQPTIFSLPSSFKHGNVPFPGTAGLQHNMNTPFPTKSSALPANSRNLTLTPSRARPLYLEKPLYVLAKDDRLGHTMFLEGIGLLAYNIAWACCSQGVPVKASYEDMFSIGRNLYNLLIGNRLLNHAARRAFPTAAVMSPSSMPRGTTGNTQNASSGNNSEEGSGADGRAPKPASIGHFSHGTAHTYLSDKTVQSFRIIEPSRLADRLKAKLSSDSTMPDWEVLEDDAWAVDDEDDNKMEDGVMKRVVISPPAAAPEDRANDNGALATSGNGGGSSVRTNRSAARGAPSGASSGAARKASGGVVVGSRVPEQRLYGVESVATVFAAMDDTVANMDPESRRPSISAPTDRAKGSGTNGWTKLRKRP